MKISIITVFPEIYDAFIKTSLVGRAIKKGLVDINIIRFSDMISVKTRIDTSTCGPGAGMVIKPDVIKSAIDKAEGRWGKGFKIFFSPQGNKVDQHLLTKLSNKFLHKTPALKDEKLSDHLILIATRYEGIEQRVENCCSDLVLSVGDFVVMGGDIPAQLLLEGLLRFIPGVVGNPESVEKDSFTGSFLDYPAYSLPKIWNEQSIPEVLLSGNHAAIEKFRSETAAKKTINKRFDWFRSSNPQDKDIKLAKKFIPNHYTALMHTQIMVPGNKVGNSSITSLDIHDIARSSATFGIEKYFVVSQLKDQQNILSNFLEFWMSNEGREYNISRFNAVKRVIPAVSFEDVIAKIKEKEGVKPIVITTSAKKNNLGANAPKFIDYTYQSKIFEQEKPVLFVFGTGQGLADEILHKSDYLLLPINGMTDYNHLSVRSAVAIVLDRWLGLYNKV